MKSLSLLAIVFIPTYLAAEPQQLLSHENGAILRVDTNLVLVPVTVTDARGAVVPDLTANDFALSEEKHRQGSYRSPAKSRRSR